MCDLMLCLDGACGDRTFKRARMTVRPSSIKSGAQIYTNSPESHSCAADVGFDRQAIRADGLTYIQGCEDRDGDNED